MLPWLARFTVAALSEQQVIMATSRIRTLSIDSLALHVELADEGLETGLARRGTMNVCEHSSYLAGARDEGEKSLQAGLRVEFLDGTQAHQVEPAIPASVAGAVFYPDDAHCDPHLFVQAVGTAAIEAGADVRTRVEVLGFRRRNRRIDTVYTTAGNIRAAIVVLAAGAWTPGLARSLGTFVPVVGGKGYHIDFESGPGDPRMPVWSDETRVVATPLRGRLRLAGMLELSGLDLSVSRTRLDAIVRAGSGLVPGLEHRRILSVWRGLRPCSADGLPIIGAHAATENAILATGHGMLGLTLAPITGRLLGELVTGERSSHDLAPFSPDRFRLLAGSRATSRTSSAPR